MNLSPQNWQAIVREAAARAVGEDVGPSDVTSQTVLGMETRATGYLVARETCVLAGLEVAEAVFREVDGSLLWQALAKDGQEIAPGTKVAQVAGSAQSILTGERCALNFMQRLSGIATLTATYVRSVKGTRAKILDTRKTTPGLRALERQAVRLGGGVNHRAGLYDGILMKENHLALVRPLELGKIIEKAQSAYPELPLVVEADEVELAVRLLALPVTRVLLDNMTLQEVQEIVQARAKLRSSVELEASGGMTVAKAQAYAQTGVDFISVGSLTHSARAIDLSLDVEQG